MTDRFDEAKRALEGTPARDVWAEAERRAADGTVVPLTPVSRPPRRVGRWIAAAAAVVLVAGTVAVLANDGDSGVDTGTGTPDPLVEDVTTYQADGGCKIGIRGEPLPKPSTVAFGAGGTMLVGHLNDVQQYAVHAPGGFVRDLVGERVEDVQLRRGTAQIWFQQVPNDAVQVRWFPGSELACESFTVSVESGTEDENRHAAVDLAERVLVGAELEEAMQPHPTPAADALDGTEWLLERSTVAGEPTQGDGSVFSFTDGTVTWNDGCNRFSGSYVVDDVGLVIGTTSPVTQTEVVCEPNATTDAVSAVMTEGPIAMTLTGELLALRKGVVELTLLQAGRTVAVPGEPYGIWPMTAPESMLGYAPEVTGSARDIALAFAERVLEWPDATVADSEPSEDGTGGSTYLVTSESTGGEVELLVHPGDAPDRHVVYSVTTPDRLADPDASLGVSVQGTAAQADVNPIPAGTTATVRFIYGEHSVEGHVGEDLEMTWTDRVPGAVLILFRDAAGNVVGATGTSLPAGDFAAS